MEERTTAHSSGDWCARLGARVESVCLSRGWDRNELARRAGISRTTLYKLEHGLTRRPHGSTLHRLAEALGVSPVEFWNPIAADAGPSRDITDPPRRETDALADDLDRRCQFDRSTNTVIPAVRADQPELFASWTAEEWDELYSTFGTGGQLSAAGVRETAQRMNRKRETLQQLNALLETHLGDVAANLIASLYQMVRPGKADTPQPLDRPTDQPLDRPTEISESPPPI